MCMYVFVWNVEWEGSAAVVVVIVVVWKGKRRALVFFSLFLLLCSMFFVGVGWTAKECLPVPSYRWLLKSSYFIHIHIHRVPELTAITTVLVDAQEILSSNSLYFFGCSLCLFVPLSSIYFPDIFKLA